MKSLLSDFKKRVSENKKTVLLGAALTATLAAYFIIWHFTISLLGPIYSTRDVAGSLAGRAAYYLLESVIIASIVCVALILVKRPLIRKFIIALALTLFLGSEVIRMFDWGALFFNGNHVDTNFWAHAFYTDGLIFLITKAALALYASVTFFFVLMFYF